MSAEMLALRILLNDTYAPLSSISESPVHDAEAICGEVSKSSFLLHDPAFGK